MLETKNMTDIFQMDEMVSDFEFAQRLYENSISEAMVNFFEKASLIWVDDMV